MITIKSYISERGTIHADCAESTAPAIYKADGIPGSCIGPDYEVVLHDLTNKDHSIIAIANSHISGRKLGAPLTNMALSILRDKSYERMDYHLHYYSINVNGKDLRSSTFFIKDSGKLIGLLCINFDDSRYRAISDHILKLCHPDLFVTDVLAQPLPENEDGVSARSSPEKFRNSADAVALDAINQELERMGVTPEQLTPEKRLQVIAALEAGGLFLLKGAVKSAAASLHCSPASVYRYITQIKNSDSGQI